MSSTESKPFQDQVAHNIADRVQDQIQAEGRIVPLVSSGPHKTFSPDQSYDLEINTNEIWLLRCFQSWILK
jgi:hypothetical protein